MEIEHVGVEGLARMEAEGVNVQPSSRVIGIIQDKYAQKVRERYIYIVIVFIIHAADIMGGMPRSIGSWKSSRSSHGR